PLAEAARRARCGQLRPPNDKRQDSTKGHQRRLAFVRAELLPALPAGSAPCGASRYFHQSSWLSMHPARSHRWIIKRESVAMLSSILPDKPTCIATSPRKTLGLRSSAPLLGATMLMSLSGPASTPATAQQPAQKPNILFIMGDDIGWMQ